MITGFGAMTPVGNDREATWRNLIAGNSAVGPITAFDASDLAVRIAAEVRGFDPARYLDRKRLRRTARFAQFAIAAAREAVADAKLDIGDGADTGVVISSPKSMTGHLIGAAGALNAMVGALAIRDGVVPPTINLKTPDPECDLDYVPNVARQMPVQTVITDTFGFGGQNCVTVLTEWRSAASP